MFVDADNLAKTLTLRTGTDRGIKREKIVGGFLERHAVGLETHGEVVADIRGQEHQAALTMTLVEGGLGRVYQARDDILGIVDRETVDDKK